MLSPEEAWAQQTDVAALITPVSRPGYELFEGNEYYGFARILKRFAGLPDDYALKAIVPHGVYTTSQVSEWEASAPLQAVLAYPAYRTADYERASDRIAIQCASPFVYALNSVEERYPQSHRAGTIVFPGHTIKGIDLAQDWDGMAHEAAHLGVELQPVTVCVHYKDLDEGRHRPFEQRGMRVVTAGHIFDQDFAVRLIHLLRSHRYMASNLYGSHVPYAVLAGCVHFRIGSVGRVTGTADIEEKAPSAPAERVRSRSLVMDTVPSASEVDDSPQPELLAAAREWLCADDALSQPDLRRLLVSLERLDRWGAAAVPSLWRPGSSLVPYRLRRSVRRVKAAWRARVDRIGSSQRR